MSASAPRVGGLPDGRYCVRGTTLLVGFDPRTALAVARSLHRDGVRVVVGTICAWEDPLPSRAIAAFEVLGQGDLSVETRRRALERVLTAHEVDTILPITDRALRWLSPLSGYIEARVRLGVPSAEQLGIILDKAATAVLARKARVPTVEAIPLPTSSSALAGMPYPLFAKLADKADQDRVADPCAPTALCVTSADELHDVIRQFGRDRILLQRYFDGDDVGLALLMRGGEAVLTFQYRARRLFPAAGGVCVAAATEAVHPTLFADALRLLRELKWEGLAQLDFRQNSTTGERAFLEINGRPWGSLAVAIAAGADFPRAWYAALHQEPFTAAGSYREGLRARWLEGDLRRLCAMRRTSSAHLTRALLEFAADFSPRTRPMFWSAADPLPALVQYQRLALNSWRSSRSRAGAIGPVSTRQIQEEIP